jgi:hypothetical protein
MLGLKKKLKSDWQSLRSRMYNLYQDTNRNKQYKGFPSKVFGMNTFAAYGFADCTFWIDAAYGLLTQTNLAAISSWKDRINNWEFAQATAGNQPRLNTANPSFNNLPTIEFFDTARFLDSQRGGLPLGTKNTLAFVAKYSSINQLNTVLGNDLGPGQIGLGGTFAGATGPYHFESTGLSIGTGSTDSTTTKIVVMTESEIWVNGVREFSGTIPAFMDWSPTKIGRRQPTTGQQLLGHVAEILIINRKLSSDECLVFSGNLNTKYAQY